MRKGILITEETKQNVEESSKNLDESSKITEEVSNDVTITPKIKKHVTIGTVHIISSHTDTEGTSTKKKSLKNGQIYDNEDSNVTYFRVDKEKKKYKGIYVHDGEKNLLLPKIRKQWESHFRFIICLLAINLCIEKFNFPLKTLVNGGIVYIICIVILTLILGCPLLYLEIYLGQFTGRGVSECWKFAPIIQGLGISILIYSFYYSTYHNSVVGWIFFYWIHTFKKPLKWNTCDNQWNNDFCRSSFKYNKNNYSQSSVEQFWYFNILLLDNNGDVFQYLEENSESIIKAFAILFIISINFLLVYFDLSLFCPLVYFLFLYPFLCILVLIGSSNGLSGKSHLFSLFFSSDYSKFYSPKLWIDALEFVIHSLSLGFGTTIALSSFNNFRNSIGGTVTIIILFDIIYLFLISLFSFQTLNLLISKNFTNVDDMKNAKLSMLFVNVPLTLGEHAWSNGWLFIYFSMLFFMGMSKSLSLIEEFLIAFSDSLPAIQIHRRIRILLFLLLFSLQYGLSFVYTTRGGYTVISVASQYSITLVNVVICFLEFSFVIYLYGFNNLTLDIKIISKKFLPRWNRLFFQLIPATILLTGIVFIFIYDRETFIKYFNKNIEVFKHRELFELIVCFVVLIPFFIFIFYYLIKSKSKFSKALLKGIKPDKTWGPSFKKYWVCDDRYEYKICYLYDKVSMTANKK